MWYDVVLLSLVTVTFSLTIMQRHDEREESELGLIFCIVTK